MFKILVLVVLMELFPGGLPRGLTGGGASMVPAGEFTKIGSMRCRELSFVPFHFAQKKLKDYISATDLVPITNKVTSIDVDAFRPVIADALV